MCMCLHILSQWSSLMRDKRLYEARTGDEPKGCIYKSKAKGEKRRTTAAD